LFGIMTWTTAIMSPAANGGGLTICEPPSTNAELFAPPSIRWHKRHDSRARIGW
jgi:hypothetical protein